MNPIASYFKKSFIKLPTAIPILFAIGIGSTSCSKYPDPSVEVLKSYNFTVIGNEQRSMASSFLTDSIGVRIIDNRTGSPAENVKVKFELTPGNGEVGKTIALTDSSGIASVHWKIGTVSNKQSLLASVIDEDDNVLGTIPILSYAFRKNTWDTVIKGYELNIRDMITDTVHHVTLILSNSLYRQGDSYFTWETDTAFSNNAYSIEIDNKLQYYLGTWNGEVYKSTNQGKSWKKATNPIAGYAGYILLKTTPGIVWASTNQHTLLCSRDEGLTWKADTVGIPKEERLGEMKQAPNGDLYMLTLNGNLYTSQDAGKSWKKILSSTIVKNIWISKSGEVFVTSAYGNLSVIRLLDNATKYESIFTVTPSFLSGSSYSFVIDYKNGYLLLMPGNGIYFTTDFKSFSPFWKNADITNFFKDANNVIIAKGDLINQVYYRNEQ